MPESSIKLRFKVTRNIKPCVELPWKSQSLLIDTHESWHHKEGKEKALVRRSWGSRLWPQWHVENIWTRTNSVQINDTHLILRHLMPYLQYILFSACLESVTVDRKPHHHHEQIPSEPQMNCSILYIKSASRLVFRKNREQRVWFR